MPALFPKDPWGKHAILAVNCETMKQFSGPQLNGMQNAAAAAAGGAAAPEVERRRELEDFDMDHFLKREAKLLAKIQDFMESPKHNPEQVSARKAIICPEPW